MGGGLLKKRNLVPCGGLYKIWGERGVSFAINANMRYGPNLFVCFPPFPFYLNILKRRDIQNVYPCFSFRERRKPRRLS